MGSRIVMRAEIHLVYEADSPVHDLVPPDEIGWTIEEQLLIAISDELDYPADDVQVRMLKVDVDDN